MARLPDDAALEALAATDPQRLYDLALTVGDNRALGKLSGLLADRETREATDLAVRLAETRGEQAEGDAWRPLVRRAAWQLVQRPSTAYLKPQFADRTPVSLDDPGTELRACLLHEMALRHGVTDEVYLAYAAGLAELGHPLAWLPLDALYFEHTMRGGSTMEGLMVGSFSPRELRACYPEVAPTAGGERAGRTARRLVDEARARTAAEGFAELAVCEVAFYTLSEPLAAGDFNAALLAGLDAQCLEATDAETITTVHTTADDLASDLFSAAFGGGLWCQGRHGAYARLAAWRSLYALMGLDTQVPHRDAVRLAAEYRWLRFALAPYSENRWFFGDFTDTAFACLDPTRTVVGVIAATETD
ncbi:DUF6183 family protein [Streptomyces sp. NPDC047017]|uniref:DUF6183 family protein n=1 Tax=Streptomyces sp. NPDC047017 TaxID=3155024 RepID=UPI0033F314C0